MPLALSRAALVTLHVKRRAQFGILLAGAKCVFATRYNLATRMRIYDRSTDQYAQCCNAKCFEAKADTPRFTDDKSQHAHHQRNAAGNSKRQRSLANAAKALTIYDTVNKGTLDALPLRGKSMLLANVTWPRHPA